MTVRDATADDGPAIREVAEQSLTASYTLSPDAIEESVSAWYDESSIAEKLSDDDVLFLVAETDGDVVGFAESVVLGDGRADLLWLHVAPAFRGQGFGDELYEAVRSRLDDRGVERVRGRVLEDNADGNEFYREQGLELIGQDEVDIGGRTYVENVYSDAERPALERMTVDEETEVYVDRDDTERGSKAPFYVVYEDPDRERRYSFVCGNCETLVTTMGTMGNLVCDACGNHSKPTRWDAGYL